MKEHAAACCDGPRRLDGRRIAAFTLIELLVVLAVASTLALIAAPRYFRSLASYRVQASANRIVADLEYARSLARTENRRVIVSFDVVDDLYELLDEVDPMRPGKGYRIDLRSEPYVSDIALAGFDGETRVGFDGYGAAVRAADGLPLGMPGIVVVRRNDVVLAVTVDHDSGRISVDSDPSS